MITQAAIARETSNAADATQPAPEWYCLRSQLKREHIAASCLRRELEIEVFLPRIRYKKSTRRGPVWFEEALFPNYLFARFDLANAQRRVQHTRGVASIVRFGEHCPSIPGDIIARLGESLDTRSVHVVSAMPEPGSTVRISGNLFHGLEAVTTQVLPARERVRVLLEFLGRLTEVELNLSDVVPAEDARRGFQQPPSQ